MKLHSKAILFYTITILLLNSYVQSSRQISLILKYDDAINLDTTLFITPKCESEIKIQQTLNQLDEWVSITSSIDSLKSYKSSLIELLHTIDESRFYLQEKQIQDNNGNNDQDQESNRMINNNQGDSKLLLTNQLQFSQQTSNRPKIDDILFEEEKEINEAYQRNNNMVSEIQLTNTNIELTLDELTERLSRIENIQNYLSTLKEEGFEDYEDYDKVLGSLQQFIQDIENLELMEDQLSINRFQLIQKADIIQSIFNQCYGDKINYKIDQQQQDYLNSDLFELTSITEQINSDIQENNNLNDQDGLLNQDNKGIINIDNEIILNKFIDNDIINGNNKDGINEEIEEKKSDSLQQSFIQTQMNKQPTFQKKIKKQHKNK